MKKFIIMFILSLVILFWIFVLISRSTINKNIEDNANKAKNVLVFFDQYKKASEITATSWYKDIQDFINQSKTQIKPLTDKLNKEDIDSFILEKKSESEFFLKQKAELLKAQLNDYKNSTGNLIK